MKLDLNSINLDWARNIYADLKTRHLLPVAGLLVAALIAVPFVIGMGGNEQSAPAPVPVASEQTAEPELDPIAVKEMRPNGQYIGGTPSNPFNQPVPQSASTDAAAVPTESAGTPTGTGTSGGSDGSTTPDEPTGTKSNDPSSAYKLDITFGTPDATKTRKNVVALTALPSADNAYVVYLGAIDSGKTAVFLVSTDVTANGDGICDPSETTCKTVELQVGDTETFKVKDDGGTGIFAEYVLKLTKIHK